MRSPRPLLYVAWKLFGSDQVAGKKETWTFHPSFLTAWTSTTKATSQLPGTVCFQVTVMLRLARTIQTESCQVSCREPGPMKLWYRGSVHPIGVHLTASRGLLGQGHSPLTLVSHLWDKWLNFSLSPVKQEEQSAPQIQAGETNSSLQACRGVL